MDLPKLRPDDRIEDSRFIVIGDTFKTHEEALKLFGAENKNKALRSSTCFFGTKKVVWFPKIAVEDKEHRLIPPSNINWCNTLSSDYSELIQRWVGVDKNNDEDKGCNNLAVEFAVFAMLPKQDEYTFLGIYKKQPHQDLYNSEVYQQKAKELYIDDWLEAQEKEKN